MFRENRTEDGEPARPDAKEICNIVIGITARDTNDEYIQDSINIEIKIKSNYTVPVYVRKGILREDVVAGKARKHYYFTDIRKGEEGEITVNFKRGSGKMYAKLFQSIEKEVN